MRVLVITPWPPVKAPEADHAFHLCKHLAAHGAEVHVVTSRGSSAASPAGITMHAIVQDWSWRDLFPFLAIIRRTRPDGILLMYNDWVYHYEPMVTFLPSFARIVAPGCRFVTQFEGIATYSRSGWSMSSQFPIALVSRCIGPERVNPIYGTLLSGSHRILVLSERILNGLVPHYSRAVAKATAVPVPAILPFSEANGGATRAERRAALGLGPADFLIAFFGYLYPGKGIETLLRAFHNLAARHNHLRLILIGGVAANHPNPEFQRYLPMLLGLAAELRIAEKLLRVGDYAWDSIVASEYLRAADLCVLPFDHGISSHNSSLAGALAHGLPVISTRGANVEPLFQPGKNIVLCPPQDPASLAEAIEAVLDDPDYYRQLREGAVNLCHQWYNWDRAVEMTLAALSGGG
jgi:polysaccharide biosynthesis protein PslF